MLKIKLKKNRGKYFILDVTRNRYLEMTPEELVRQNYVIHLINDKGYSSGNIILEYTFSLNGKTKRADMLILNKDNRPFILGEFKSNNVTLDTKVLDQVMLYNTELKAEYLVITNGIDLIVLLRGSDNKYLKIKDIPEKDSLWKE